MDKHIINEELGIHDGIYDAANGILDRILSDSSEKMKSGKFTDTLNGSAVLARGSFSFPFEDRDVSITYNSYVFDDEETYRECVSKYPRMLMDSEFSFGNGEPELYVVVNSVRNAGCDESVLDRIQHELSHALQSIRKNGPLGNSELKKMVNSGLRMRGKDNEIFMASFILYCSRKYEQDAFANGLYSRLMNLSGNEMEIIGKSALYKNMMICRKYISILSGAYGEGNQEQSGKFIKALGISPGRIIQKGRVAVDRMERLMRRTVAKYRSYMLGSEQKPT